MESSSLPLAGIKVVDLSRVLAGPFCAMLLSYLGAEVIKVEDHKGDETRAWPPFSKDMSDSFLAVNVNKKDIVVDLTGNLFSVDVKQSFVLAINQQIPALEVLDVNDRGGVVDDTL